MVYLCVGEKKKPYQAAKNIPQLVSEPEVLYAVRQNRVSSEYLTNLKHVSGLSDEILSDSLNMNIKTFRNYKLTSLPLKPLLQEHVFALLALYNHGIEVFGSHKPFNEWLDRINIIFDNDKPLHFLTTISGIKFIDNRLSAIQYGDNV